MKSIDHFFENLTFVANWLQTSEDQQSVFNQFCSVLKKKTGKELTKAQLKWLRRAAEEGQCLGCEEFLAEYKGDVLRPLYLYFAKGKAKGFKPCGYHFDCLYKKSENALSPEQKLYKAAEEGDLIMVQTLLFEGADVAWHDERWNTAYDVAKTPEIAALVKPSYWSRMQRCYTYLNMMDVGLLKPLLESCSTGALAWALSAFMLPREFPFSARLWVYFTLERLVKFALRFARYHAPQALGIRGTHTLTPLQKIRGVTVEEYLYLVAAVNVLLMLGMPHNPIFSMFPCLGPAVFCFLNSSPLLRVQG